MRANMSRDSAAGGLRQAIVRQSARSSSRPRPVMRASSASSASVAGAAGCLPMFFLRIGSGRARLSDADDAIHRAALGIALAQKGVAPLANSAALAVFGSQPVATVSSSMLAPASRSISASSSASLLPCRGELMLCPSALW
jgi:hypothetical protein